MNLSVAVLCVLCAFVVKNPLSAALLHRSRRALWVPFLHRTRMVAARMSTTSRFAGARHGTDVGTNVGHFRPSAPPPSLLAASLTPTKIAKIIFNVIKCNHVYGQPPSSTLWNPTKTLPMWGNVGVCGSVWQ